MGWRGPDRLWGPMKPKRASIVSTLVALATLAIALLLTVFVAPALNLWLSRPYNADIPSIDELKLTAGIVISAIATLLAAISSFLLTRERVRKEVREEEFERLREATAASARRINNLFQNVERMFDTWRTVTLNHKIPPPTNASVVQNLQSMKQEIRSQLADAERITDNPQNPLLLPYMDQSEDCPKQGCYSRIDFSNLGPYPGNQYHNKCRGCRSRIRGTRADDGRITAVVVGAAPAEEPPRSATSESPKTNVQRPAEVKLEVVRGDVKCPNAGCGEIIKAEFWPKGCKLGACIECATSIEYDPRNGAVHSLGKRELVLDNEHVLYKSHRMYAQCECGNTIAPNHFRRNKRQFLAAACFKTGHAIIDVKGLLEDAEAGETG